MCGRYTLSQTQSMADYFQLDEPEMAADLPPRFNIAPSQPVPVVFQDSGKRQLLVMRWGLIPQWMKPLDGNKPPAGWINARSETADTKPAFRGAYKYRRCLIPADGFYEWPRDSAGKKTGGKQPHLIRRADDGLFAFAGLFEWWCPPDGSELPTCTILTTKANQTLAPIHDRMPVILEPEDHTPWLTSAPAPGSDHTPEISKRANQADFLFPPSGGGGEGRLYTTPVSTRVNQTQHDDPSCMAPAPRHHSQPGLFE